MILPHTGFGFVFVNVAINLRKKNLIHPWAALTTIGLWKSNANPPRLIRCVILIWSNSRLMEFCCRVIKLCLHERGIINLIIVLKNKSLIRQIQAFVAFLGWSYFGECGINAFHSARSSAVSAQAMDMGFNE